MPVNLERKRLRTIKKDMMRRCYSVKCKDYRYYGGKGITVCDEWHTAKNFIAWAYSSGYQDGLTIDRIDPKKNYSPDNCRWISQPENCRYKSTTNCIDVGGVLKSGREWASTLCLGINSVNRILGQYGEDITKEFIKRRLENPSLERQGTESWLEAYGII